MSEYRVEPLPDGRFAVLSERGERAFAGTLGECSDWLDARASACRAPGEPERAEAPVSPVPIREG